MSKDPAFLFYSSDFLTGTADLTMEEHGQYITLLCMQHQKGRLSGKAVALAAPNASQDVLSKFEQDKDGLYFNARLEEEITKRRNFSKSQREKALKRWGNKGEDDSAAPTAEPEQPSGKPPGNAPASAENIPLEDVNTNADESKDHIKKPSKSEIEAANLLAENGMSPQLSLAWMDWIRYKKEQHGFEYKSRITMEKALRDLLKRAEQDDEKAVIMLDYAQIKGWKGFDWPMSQLPKDLSERIKKNNSAKDIALKLVDDDGDNS